MSMRLPTLLSSSPHGDTGLSALETELLAERAASLGRLGSEVERALAALRAANVAPGDAEHEALTNAAARAVWYLIIQRDVCGVRGHEDVIRQYDVPAPVLARLGAKG